jgi:membrane dipeptidase
MDICKLKPIAAVVLFANTLTACSNLSSEIHQGYSDTASEYEVDGKVVSNVDTEAGLWNPRGKTKEQLAERGKFLGEAYNLKRTDSQMKRAQAAKGKYQDSIYVNSVMIGSVGMVEMLESDYSSGIQANLKAGAAAVSVTAFAYPGDGDMSLMDRLDESIKIINDNDDYVFIDGVESIRKAKADGKLTVLFNAQGVDWATEDLSQLNEAHKRGVMVTNLVYNNDNAFAGGGSKQASGLTDLGREFVKRANKLGVVMDCSHSSNKNCMEDDHGWNETEIRGFLGENLLRVYKANWEQFSRTSI